MTEQSKFPGQLKTPVDISIPMVGILDHGLSLVHDLGGTPRNYLHEVSIGRDEQDAIRYLQSAGYSQRCGWIGDRRVGMGTIGEEGRAYWTYSKPFPLTVAAWGAK
jgi:hypothetical protein